MSVRGKIRLDEEIPVVSCACCSTSIVLVGATIEQMELHLQHQGWDLYARLGWCCKDCRESGAIDQARKNNDSSKTV